MMIIKKYPDVHRDKARAFSLVLSLTMMAMLLILCIGATALLSIQLRVARVSVSMSNARLNAISAARIALGTLQSFAGDDRRITAPATILSTAPTDSGSISNGVNAPRLTGVWKGRSVNSDYARTHDDAFIGWLVSGTTAQRGSSELLAYPKIASLNGGNAVRLLADPATTPASAPGLEDNDPAAVYAAPESILDQGGNTVGKIAWWISDENQKANLSLRIPPSSSVSDALENTRNAPRFGLKLATDGEFGKFPETTPFVASIFTRASLAFDTPTPTATASAWMADSRDYYHSVTPYSESLLTDVVNGGLKYDLSLMFAMDVLPAGYFGAQGYVGLESLGGGSDSYAAAKSGWMASGAPAGITLASLTSKENRLEWTCWGDVWNYARLYKHPAFNAGTGMLMNSAADASGTSSNPMDPQGNVPDIQNLSPWREPVITQMQVIVGIQTVPTSDPTKLNINIIQRPYIQLWNPYNVPLRFTGVAADSIGGNFTALPGKLTIGVGGTTYALDQWASLSSLSGGFYVFQLFLDFRKQTTLAPGEVRVFSPVGSSIVMGGQGSGVTLSSGLRPFGGFGTMFRWPPNSYTTTAVTCAPTDIITASIRTSTTGWYAADNPYLFAKWGRSPQVQRYGIPSAAGRGCLVPWSAAGGGRQLLGFDTAAVSSPASLLTGSNPRFFGLLTMRLRAETAAATRIPTFSYGDPLRWIYNPAAKKNYEANQDVWLSPYEFTQSHISSDTDSGPQNNPVMQSDSLDRGYAFTDFTPTFGVSNMIFSHIPLAPLGSLGDLRDARLGGGVSYTRAATAASPMTRGYSVVPNAFANSRMHPMVGIDALRGSSATFANEDFYDFSWITNAALWDSYFLSGLTPHDSPVTLLNGPALTLDEVAGNFFIKGKGLPDKRLVPRDYGIGPEAMMNLLESGSKPRSDGYAKSAASIGVSGGFNINSTSVRAWRSLLAGLNDGQVPTLGDSTAISASAQAVNSGNPVLRNPVQNGELADVNTGDYNLAFNRRRAMAGRKLSDDQLTTLAQQIVLQVKKRGPFLSLGEFMNRRLEPSVYGNSGVLQAAIDASGINAFAASTSVKPVDAAVITSLFPTNPAAIATPGAPATMARGMPGFISQADLVGPVATMLTPRSDTFIIRASGTSDDGATAYVEMVVQRTSSFVDTTDTPYVVPAKLTKTVNKAFGRRFAILATRWMDAEAI